MKFATAKEDAFRRDLTINAIFYNIDTNQIEDYTGVGLTDLKEMRLRMPGVPKERLLEDPQRLLRILRFYSRYPNAEIDDKTYEAMKDDEVQNHLTRQLYDSSATTGITAERVADELRKLMKSDNPAKGLATMFNIGLGQKIFLLPNSFDPEGWEMNQRNKHHAQTILGHTLAVIRAINQISQQKNYSDTTRMLLNFAALFHDVGKIDPSYQQTKESGERSYHSHELGSADMASAIGKALKLSNSERSLIASLARGHMRPHQYAGEEAQPQGISALRRFQRRHTLQVDMSEIQKKLIEPNLDPEKKAELEDELKSLQERQNLWDLLLSLGAADASAKHAEIDKAKQRPYLELQEEISGFQTPIQVPDLLNGHEIMAIFAPYGADPATGYIEKIKERIRELRDENPNLTKDDAATYLEGHIQDFITIN